MNAHYNTSRSRRSRSLAFLACLRRVASNEYATHIVKSSMVSHWTCMISAIAGDSYSTQWILPTAFLTSQHIHNVSMLLYRYIHLTISTYIYIYIYICSSYLPRMLWVRAIIDRRSVEMTICVSTMMAACLAADPLHAIQIYQFYGACRWLGSRTTTATASNTANVILCR